MKKVYAVFGRIICIALYIMSIGARPAYAQSCGNAATVPTNFSTWNWEEPEQDPITKAFRPEYCNTWEANIGTTGGTVTKYPMKAPWVAASTPFLFKIGQLQDYKKANGWELIKFDFGGTRGSIAVPYFILYHKPTGVLRVFAFLQGSGYQGVVFTMKHSSNDKHSPANLSASRSLLLAPDKYISAPESEDEILTYVSFYGGEQTWAMGQFTMLFDPNTSNSAFNLSAYQIQVSGMTKSDVQITGAFQYKTAGSEKADFSFSGPTSNVSTDINSGLTTVGTEATKFLGSLTTLDGKLTEVNSKADNFITFAAKTENKNIDIVQDLGKVSSKVLKYTGNPALKGLLNFASEAGSFFSLAGSIIGLFADDPTGKASVVPTVSKGTITLSGTITSTAAKATINLYIPGTNQYDPGSGSTIPSANLNSYLPYYNCPLGIFNIKNTPAVKRINYPRNTALVYYGGPNSNPSEDISKPFSSFRLVNSILPVVNAASGLKILSVKYAIAQKVLLKDVSTPYIETTGEYINGTISNVRRYNFLYSQVASGVLEVYPLDPGTNGTGSDATVIVQTPFIDAACSDSYSIPYNCPAPTNDSPLYIRVVAELTAVDGSSGGASTYFSQDYYPETQSSEEIKAYGNGMYGSNQPFPLDALPPDYTQLAAGYAYPASDYYYPTRLYNQDIIKDGQLTYDDNHKSEIANRTLLFAQGSNTSVKATSASNPLIPVLFHASKSIGIEGQLSVEPGSVLVISTEYASLGATGQYTCAFSPSQYAVANQQCSPNTTANRISDVNAATDSPVFSQLVAYPNPATNSTLIKLNVTNDDCIQQVDLLGVTGHTLWQKSFSCTHSLQETVPLNNLPTGIYIVRVTTSSKVYTSKISVE
jgi:hypothetical protein